MWIERDLSDVLRRGFTQFPVVALTGSRQAGKTSLARRIFPKADYVSFDVPQAAEKARLDPEGFFADRKEPLIMDEIQYVPEVLRHLKAMIDVDRRPGRFLLTGSQDFALMQGVSESLAGRCAVLSLPTLSLAEVFPNATIADTDAFCWRSGFPRLWQDPQQERDLWMGSYLATYLERDVRNILNVGSLRDFDRFLRVAALRAGQLLSLSDLARDVGIAPNTARSWISALQASQQVFLLEPYHHSAGKRLVKTPKLYFAETGLLVYLLGFINWESVVQNPFWGSIWENLVISEIRKSLMNSGKRSPLWFWRTSQGDEVDLLIDVGAERFLAVECKVGSRVDKRQMKGMRSLVDNYGANAVQKAAFACRTSASYPLGEKGLVSARPLGGPEGVLAWIMQAIQ